MRTTIHSIILFAFGFMLSACSIAKTERGPIRIETLTLLSKRVKVQLPVHFHFQKDKFEEGIIYSYSFPDSAYIIIFQGAMMEFPIDKYLANKTETNKQKKIYTGIKNNKCCRKDVLGNIRIYYDNVSTKSKAVYDKILDEIQISPLVE